MEWSVSYSEKSRFQIRTEVEKRTCVFAYSNRTLAPSGMCSPFPASLDCNRKTLGYLRAIRGWLVWCVWCVWVTPRRRLPTFPTHLSVQDQEFVPPHATLPRRATTITSGRGRQHDRLQREQAGGVAGGPGPQAI